MSAIQRRLDSAIDGLAVQSDGNGADLLLVGQTTFTGRFWTGALTATASSGQEISARADLRAGVAAVDWLREATTQDGAVAVSGSDDGSIDLWQTSPGSEAMEMQHLEGRAAHNHIVSSISSTIDGANKLASSSWDMQIGVWDAVSFIDCVLMLSGHADLVHAVCWADEDRLLLSASQDATVRLWDPRSGGCTAIMPQQHPVHCVAAEAGSGLVAAGDECGSLAFFDTRQASTPVAQLRGLHHDAIKAIAFAPAGGSVLVASGGDDGRICIIPRGQPISAVKQQVRTPHSDGAYIRSVCYGQAGMYSGAWDGTLACSKS